MSKTDVDFDDLEDICVKEELLKTERAQKHPEEYRGMFMEDSVSEKQRKKNWTHPIFLFSPDEKDMDNMINFKLNQVVHVEEHTLEDFEFNAKKIAKHYRKHYGDVAKGIGMYTLGQSIAFTVYKGQQEPFVLPLFKFFINYTFLLIPVELGVDLHGWKPWTPTHWSDDAWAEQMDKYIEKVRPYANMRKICECISLSKYLIMYWATKAGDRQGLSISNNDFIEVMKRSKEAYESITCTFPIPDDISPTDLEKMTMDRTTKLLKFIGEQTDLPISIYARNNLFNPSQFREYAVHLCYKPDLSGNTIPYTYPTNVIMGINDIRAFSIDAHGGRKAEITKLKVSDAGTLERALMMLMSPVRYVDNDYECDSKHFRKRLITSQSDLIKLDGRVMVEGNPKDNRYRIIDPHNTDLIGRTVLLKTPITCTHPRRSEGYICSACYGKLMASLNRDLHIGRIAAAESADEIEQKLLSAKHALKTNTVRVEFDETFYHYFSIGTGTIMLSRDIISESTNSEASVHHLYLEFYPATMKKNQDGESRHFDREFSEIVIYDERDDSRITISEKNGAPLYLSPEFNDSEFLPAIHYMDSTAAGTVVRIPFDHLVDNGEVIVQTLFEFSYKNREISDPLMTLEKIMFNGESINAFPDYDNCLDTLLPLFIAGGIWIPDYQTELLVSQLVWSKDGKMVDWNDPHPEYVFNSISKSIYNNPSVLTSILYRESGAQIAGAFNAYDKFGTSAYDAFVTERKASQWD